MSYIFDILLILSGIPLLIYTHDKPYQVIALFVWLFVCCVVFRIKLYNETGK